MTEEELQRRIDEALKQAEMDEEDDPNEREPDGDADDADPDPHSGDMGAASDDQVRDEDKRTGKERLSRLERIWTRLKAQLGAPEPIEDGTGFKVQGNHWIAWWSNNFKDRDDEIFTEKAIDDYVARVDMGIVDPPVLQIWHIGDQTAIGKAAWVARHGHSIMAAGEFNADTPDRVKAYYRKNAHKTSLSHGFTFPVKQFKQGVYHAFNTFEISLLPRGAEANSYTSLEGVKEMALTQQKLDYLKKEVGYTDEEIKSILDSRSARDKAIEATGEAFKDFAEAQPGSTDSGQADKTFAAFKDLFPELIAADAENAEAAEKTARVVMADHARLDQMAQDLKALKAMMNERPKRASQAEETELDREDEDDKSIIDEIERENVDEKMAKNLPGFFDQKFSIKQLANYGNGTR